MEKEVCKFNSQAYCNFSGQPPDGVRVSIATATKGADDVMLVFASDKGIRQQMLDGHLQRNSNCRSIETHLMNGFCAACRKVCAASGITDIREEK
ncbi:MAG: hypothetical protein PHX87_00535 [Candidatus Peribacteraceae bacterium]|nr:hypothetical protein [Candidatus Peribacteraceae bacterium]MDD5741895.1 hypothetical protein [Candidatus Peribacteraceae bacterium]